LSAAGSTKNVLLVSTDRKSRELLPPAIEAEAPEIRLVTIGRIGEAVARLSSLGVDGVVCCADNPEDLAHVIRIRKAHPAVPVVLLSRVPAWGFDALAQSFGATAVVTKSGDLRQTAGTLAVAIKTHCLAQQQRFAVSRNRQRSKDIRRLSEANRALVEMALGATAAQRGQFFILLVEADADRALAMIEAVSAAGLPPILRTARSAEEAIKYLSGRDRYSDRSRYPTPGLVVSNLELPGKSGLELLRWVRTDPESHDMGFIMLMPARHEEDISKAYDDGANLHLLQTATTKDLVEVLQDIYTQFMSQKLGPDYFPWKPAS
jgi:CheY-like chemotaxis protein